MSPQVLADTCTPPDALRGGLEAVEPRPSTGSNSKRTRDGAQRSRATTQLTKGLDAARSPSPGTSNRGPEPRRPPRSAASCTRGLIPEPRKRPRSSYNASTPRNRTSAGNRTSPTGADGTEWRSSTGSTTTPATCSALQPPPVTGDVVTSSFVDIAEEHGLRLDLTDNGRVYTARFGGGRTPSSTCWPLGVTQKNGHPGHPQTRARSSASTRPSNAGSPTTARTTLSELQPSSTPSAPLQPRRPTASSPATATA